MVDNTFVKMENVERERQCGTAVNTAIVEAAGLGLWPILITTRTAVLGTGPLAIGISEGAGPLQPLANVLVWGLSSLTRGTLFLQPSIFRLFNAGGIDRCKVPPWREKAPSSDDRAQRSR